MYTKLLIPLDGSRAAESALIFADLLERVAPVPIELVTAIDVSAMTAHVVGTKARYLGDLIAEAERNGRAYLKGIAAGLKHLEVSCTVERGKPADIIIERAGAAAKTLILMATHGRSGIDRWLLGSIAEKVLRGTSAPLLLVRSAGDESRQKRAPIRSIIVPLDGSVLAEAVLPTATEMAKQLNTEMVLIRAYELPAEAYYGREDYLPDYDELKKQGKAAAEAYLEEKAAAIRVEGVRNVNGIVAEGIAAAQIIECARNVPDSLLAMSTHGRSGIQRWTLGSVTETVVRHTRQPVLVLHAAQG